MKRCIAGFLFFTVMLAGSSAFAQMQIKQAGNFGIGLGAGTTAYPISLKYFLSDTLSVQGNVGWARWGWGWGNGYYGGWGWRALGLGADILYEGGTLAGNSDLTLDWEVGGGAGLTLAGGRGASLGLAVAGVVGLQLNIHALPIDFVVEYRPTLWFVPNGDLWFAPVDFTGHVRYYF